MKKSTAHAKRLAAAATGLPGTKLAVCGYPMRHHLLDRGGVEVFRVYRHGNPLDVFMCAWFRTANSTAERHPTDFDVRALPADINERHGVPTTSAGLPDLQNAMAAIREAIDRGAVTTQGGPRLPPLQLPPPRPAATLADTESDGIPF